MSSSRRGGVSVTWRARASRSSVVRPIADTTVQIRSPLAALRTIRSATPSSLGRSATELPPYFCTTTSMGQPPPGPYITGDGKAATGPDFSPRNRARSPVQASATPGGVILEASTGLPVELYHSPLEGESVRQGPRPQSNRWGGRNRLDRQIGDSARSRAGWV